MSIKETIDRIQRWSNEDENLREIVLEKLLLFDLFRGSLDYDIRSAVSQESKDRMRQGVADLILKPAQRTKGRWIVVEIKRPSGKANENAVKQAGAYVASRGACHGVVTNGKVWIFFRIKLRPRAKYRYSVDVLLRLRSPEETNLLQRRLLEKTLSRCGKNTISVFFETLTRVFDLGKVQIQQIMLKHKPPDWPNSIADAVSKSSGWRIGRHDISVFEAACKDVGLFTSCFLGPFKDVEFSLRKKRR